MEFFDWINVVQVFTQYFTMATSGITLDDLIKTIYISIYVSAGLYLIFLVFGGLGMHAMAKKVGMKHSWLAFLPFANTWYAGKLAGETRVFGQKMKRVGLYAMISEIIYVAISLFALIIQLALYNPAYFELGEDGTYYLITNNIPLSIRWMVSANFICDFLVTISYLVLIFFLCTLFYAFFRKYYARGPFLMTFLCAVLPLRGLVIFAVRNNTPVDYDAYMRRRMEQYARRSGGAYPYGQGGYDADGNRTGGAPQDEPFSDFGGASPGGGAAGNADNTGNPDNSGGDDPFPDF